MKNENPDKKYQDRVILFIDLLGFKNAVNGSVYSDELFAKVMRAVNSLYKAKGDNYNGSMKGTEIGVEISTFSDSLVISKDIYEPGSFYYLLNMAYFAIIEIVASGFVARGAITVEKLYHDEKVIFGPAINDAYVLESKCAIYPRVIVQKDVVEKMLLKDHFNEIEEERRWYEKLLKEDEDGLLFVDFLTPNHQFDDFEAYCWLLGQTKKIIQEGLNSNIDESVKQKYIWLKTYFNKTLELLDADNEMLPTKIM